MVVYCLSGVREWGLMGWDKGEKLGFKMMQTSYICLRISLYIYIFHPLLYSTEDSGSDIDHMVVDIHIFQF